MAFIVREHGGISPRQFERPFFLKHFTPYRFSRGLIENKKVLEIGFGDGYGSFYLAPYAESLIAIDLFYKNAALAKKEYHHQALKFMAADATRIAFRDKIFDIVLAFQLIEHTPRELHHVFLEEVKRVLRADGLFIMTTPNLLCLQKKGKRYAKNPHHDLEFSPDTLQCLLREHFDKVRIYKIDYSFKQKFFLKLKRIGIFKYMPPVLNVVERYFKSMSEEDFVVKEGPVKKAPDILAVCSMQSDPAS